MTIHEEYERAALLHGHRCPGLAIGVRAAAEAKRILKIEDIQEKGICCAAECGGCCLDGIQAVLGCTAGKGSLFVLPLGKTAFSVYRAGTGESLRLVQRELPAGMSRGEKTEFILTAPIERVFSLGAPRRSAPHSAKRGESGVCAGCGETTDVSALTERGGKLICGDCMEGHSLPTADT